MAMVTLDAADNGTTVTVPVGATIEVRLAENPTTGFRWALEPIAADSLVALDDRYEPAPPMRIGSGGTRIFRFRAVAAGSAALALRHWQAWSGEESITERFAVELCIVP
ncbi:MAG: protease inhibitor I42 family protein [Rhodospirillales bacterium]